MVRIRASGTASGALMRMRSKFIVVIASDFQIG